MAYIDYTSNDSNTSLENYIKEKIRLIREDFCIALNNEQIAHMKALKNEIQVDNYAQDIIQNH
jgi:hypothetical protein